MSYVSGSRDNSPPVRTTTLRSRSLPSQLERVLLAEGPVTSEQLMVLYEAVVAE